MSERVSKGTRYSGISVESRGWVHVIIHSILKPGKIDVLLGRQAMRDLY